MGTFFLAVDLFLKELLPQSSILLRFYNSPQNWKIYCLTLIKFINRHMNNEYKLVNHFYETSL